MGFTFVGFFPYVFAKSFMPPGNLVNWLSFVSFEKASFWVSENNLNQLVCNGERIKTLCCGKMNATLDAQIKSNFNN
jgi:hypothetical protein